MNYICMHRDFVSPLLKSVIHLSFAGKKQVKKIEHQEPRYQPFADHFNEEKKQDVKLVMEHMQSKMEKMQEDMNNTKQLHKTSAKCVVGTGALEKTSDEGFKGSDLMQNRKKKVFIRSRL